MGRVGKSVPRPSRPTPLCQRRLNESFPSARLFMNRFVVPVGVGLALLFSGSTSVRGPMQLGSSASAQSQGRAGAAGDPLQQLSDRFEAIASRVTPAVVAVEAVKPAKPNTN